MHPLITPECHQILELYSREEAKFLFPFLEAKVLQRLADISQNCGTGYCKFYKYAFNHSRLDHSLGVALIIRNFTKDKKQALAGLFHDVSHSVFSHVGDFLLGDQENQESSEQYTTKLLQEDTTIIRELEHLGISLDEVDDYTQYSIADNPGPKLSADRLEYTLSTAINLQTKTFQKVGEIYNNLEVIKNQEGQDELGFSSPEIAEEFALLSLQHDASCFSSYESTVAQSFLAEILRKMLEKGPAFLEHLLGKMDEHIKQKGKILLLTLTKKSSEEVTNFLVSKGYKAFYLA
jgi:uncharacterized protein